MMKLPEESPISCFGGKFLLSGRPYDTIFQMDKGNLSQKYLVDFGSFNYTVSEISQGYQILLSLFQEGRRYGWLDYMMENNSWVYFTYRKMPDGKGSEVPVIYSKTKQKCADFTEVLNHSGLPPLSVRQVRANDLICLFTPGDFDESALRKYALGGFIPKETTPDSNPVVTIIEISARN